MAVTEHSSNCNPPSTVSGGFVIQLGSRFRRDTPTTLDRWDQGNWRQMGSRQMGTPTAGCG